MNENKLKSKVLYFGDSISGGYTKGLTELLSGKADLVKLGAVAGYRVQTEPLWKARRPAINLDFGSAKACISDFDRFEKHISEAKYDLIHFNFGLNDIFRGREGSWYNPPENYAEDLTKIVELLKDNCKKIIWANTTPIPLNDPTRPVGDDLIYNNAAEKVMAKYNIPINDLHSVITDWQGFDEWRKGDDVHFSDEVSFTLAEQVMKVMLSLLDQPEDSRAQ